MPGKQIFSGQISLEYLLLGAGAVLVAAIVITAMMGTVNQVTSFKSSVIVDNVIANNAAEEPIIFSSNVEPSSAAISGNFSGEINPDGGLTLIGVSPADFDTIILFSEPVKIQKNEANCNGFGNNTFCQISEFFKKNPEKKLLPGSHTIELVKNAGFFEKEKKSVSSFFIAPKELVCANDKDCAETICPMVVGSSTPKCDSKMKTCYCGGECGDGYCDSVEKANGSCRADCENILIYSNNNLKIVSSKLVSPHANNILLERITEDGKLATKIYELIDNKIYYKSKIFGFVHEIIAYSENNGDIKKWFAIATKADFEIDKIWKADSLTGIWERDFEKEKGFCLRDSPCDPENGNAALAIVEFFNKDYWDINFFVSGPAGCQPNASVDGMDSWLQQYLSNVNYNIPVDSAVDFVYYGGECPLDNTFAERAPITRIENKAISVNFDSKESLWNDLEENLLGNRRVQNILVKDDYLIYTGEGWIGKAPQFEPQGKWQFPIFHDSQEEYLYSTGILEARDLIIVYGFDKAKAPLCNNVQCIQLKISNNKGDSFSSAEEQLNNYLAGLIENLPKSWITSMGFDPTSDKIYLIITQMDKTENGYLYSIPYSEFASWAQAK